MIDLSKYEEAYDAQHYESEYKVQASQNRRARRERRELKAARKENRA